MEYLSGYEQVKVIDHVLFRFTTVTKRKRMKAKQNNFGRKKYARLDVPE